MLLDLLIRLERQPDAYFTDRELAFKNLPAFRELIRQRLLRRRPTVVATITSFSGFVQGQNFLGAETPYGGDGLHQALQRLRDQFFAALHGLPVTEFIELRDGRVRLSTHRRFISYDRAALLDHPVQETRATARALPTIGEYQLPQRVLGEQEG